MNITKNEEIILSAIERAWEDQSFKNELINDPRKALASVSNSSFDLNNETGIKFIDAPSFSEDDEMISKTNSELVVKIPPRMDLSDIELSEEELELVSGGFNLYVAYILWKNERDARRRGEAIAAEIAAAETSGSSN